MEATTPSAVLLVIKSPLYGSGRAGEGLRVATAMIAMDVLPQILFIGDGVYCLLRNQAPEVAGLASLGERLKAIADLTGIHVLSDSLATRNLKRDDLESDYNVKTLTLDETVNLFAQSKSAITF
jgi:sulfur relay (sulfurtransferase) DsrF/TusC family protein